MIFPTKQCDFHIFFMKLWESVRPEHIQYPLMSSELASAALTSQINSGAESVSTGEINILTCPICSNSLSFWCNFFVCLLYISITCSSDNVADWSRRHSFCPFCLKEEWNDASNTFLCECNQSLKQKAWLYIERTSTEKADYCLDSHYLWKQCYVEFSSYYIPQVALLFLTEPWL